MALAHDDGTPMGKLTMGLGWDKKRGAGALSGSNTPDVDLDATAIQYAGEQLFDLAFFNHLETRDGSGHAPRRQHQWSRRGRRRADLDRPGEGLLPRGHH